MNGVTCLPWSGAAAATLYNCQRTQGQVISNFILFCNNILHVHVKASSSATTDFCVASAHKTFQERATLKC